MVRWLLSPRPAGPCVREQLHWLNLEGRPLAELTRMWGHVQLADTLVALAAECISSPSG